MNDVMIFFGVYFFGLVTGSIALAMHIRSTKMGKSEANSMLMALVLWPLCSLFLSMKLVLGGVEKSCAAIHEWLIK